MFYVVVVITKVVYNFIIYLLLNFHDHMPDSLGSIDFIISLLGFHALCIDLNDCVVWLSLALNHVLEIIEEV